MKDDARGDVEFLRNLVLRADSDAAAERRHFLVWGLTWIAVFGLDAAFPRSDLAAAIALVLILLVAFGPWARLRLRVAARGPDADLGPLPMLWRAFNVAIVAAGLLAYGLVAVLRARSASPVQDGRIWLLIVGAAYLASSVFIRGMYGGGRSVPGRRSGGTAPGARSASGWSRLRRRGRGTLLSAAAFARRARS